MKKILLSLLLVGVVQFFGPAFAAAPVTVSDAWLAAHNSDRDGSNPMKRGVCPCVGVQPVEVIKPVRGSDANVAMLSCPRLEQ